MQVGVVSFGTSSMIVIWKCIRFLRAYTERMHADQSMTAPIRATCCMLQAFPPEILTLARESEDLATVSNNSPLSNATTSFIFLDSMHFSPQFTASFRSRCYAGAQRARPRSLEVFTPGVPSEQNKSDDSKFLIFCETCSGE
jgi:hypothetical protein